MHVDRSAALLGDHLFAGGIGNVAVLLKLAADKPRRKKFARQKTPPFYPVNSTRFSRTAPLRRRSAGQLRGVKLEDRERLWKLFCPTPAVSKGTRAPARPSWSERRSLFLDE